MGAPRPADTVHIGEQTTFGTAVTASLLVVPIAGEPTLAPVNNDFKSQQWSAKKEETIPRKGNYHFEGTLPCELGAAHIVPILKNLCGNYTYAVDDPVAGANTHEVKITGVTAEIAQLLQKGMTIEIGGDANYSIVDSAVFTSFEMGEIEQGVIPVTVGYMARKETEAGSGNGSATPNDTGELMDTLQGVISAGVDASEVAQPVTTASLSITKEGVSAHYRASSNLCTQFVQDGRITVKGTFETEVDDTEYAAIKSAFDAGTEQSVIFLYTSSVLITGSTYYSITFDMPECVYTSLEPRTDGNLRFAKIGFEAGRNSGADVITITAINTETTF